MTAASRPGPVDAGTVDAGTVDAESPWPGLASFREADRELFHGREAETEALLRLVLRQRVAVLFGLSGLGKTSLLEAGLFPRLREENVLPVRLRLDLAAGSPPPAAQVLAALERAMAAAGVEAPAGREGETLWEYFHRQGAQFWSPRNRLVTPLLAFDQFEEIFTLGRRDAASRQRSEGFVAELAHLCEGAPPEPVRARLDAHPDLAREFAYSRHPYKVLFSLREDYLADLEGLRAKIRSLGTNRFRLCRMNGDNALRVVTLPGGRLIEPGVAERVVRFVAGEEPGEEPAPLADLEVEPALLSVVCRELNAKRRARGEARITADLLAGSRAGILTTFYERSVADLGPEVRTFVEERLVTVSGFRDSVALENALVVPGVTREAIDRLTERRLLRVDDRGDGQRLELTHDVLAGVVRASRDARRRREERESAEAARRAAEEEAGRARRQLRRSRLVIALLSALLVGMVVLAWWAVRAEDLARTAQAEARAAEATTRANLVTAYVDRAVSLQTSRSDHGLAYAARALSLEPKSVPARHLVVQLLLHRSWPLPIAAFPHDAGVSSARFSPDGRLLVTASTDGTARIWDVAAGQPAGAALEHGTPLRSAEWSPDGRWLLTVAKDGEARRWEASTGALLATLRTEPFGSEAAGSAISPDGRWIFVRSARELEVWDVASGRPAMPRTTSPTPIVAAFSPDGGRIAVVASSAGAAQELRVIDLPSGRSVGTAIDTAELKDLDVAPDGRTLITASLDGAEVWELAPGVLRRVRKLTGARGDPIVEAHVSPDGERIVTVSLLGTARLWDREGQPLGQAMEGLTAGAALSPDGRFLAAHGNTVRLWDARSGRAVAEPIHLQGATVSFNPAPDARQIATASADGTVRVWSVRAGRAGTEVLRLGSGSPLKYLPADGRHVATAAGETVRLWDTSTGREVGTIPAVGAPPESISLHDGDPRIAATMSQGTARLWEVGSGRLLGAPLAEVALLRDSLDGPLRLSRDGERLLVIERQRRLHVLDPATGAAAAGPLELPSPAAWRGLSASAGLGLAVAGSEARVWDLRARQPLGAPIPVEDVAAAEWSPDGRWIAIAAGSETGTVGIWDARTGEPRIGPIRHVGRTPILRFDAAGKVLLTQRRAVIRRFDAERGTELGGPIELPGWGEAALDPQGERIATVRLGSISLWAVTGQSLGPLADSLGQAVEARFTPDAARLLVTFQRDVRAFDLPLVPPEGAADLVHLGEAVAGAAIDEAGRPSPLADPAESLEQLRRGAAGAPPGEATAASLIRWFLADRDTRTVSPLSPVTVPQSIERLLALGTAGAREEALRAFPGHPLLSEGPRTPAEPSP